MSKAVKNVLHFCFLFFTTSSLRAQDTLQHVLLDSSTKKIPSAVLVQLRSERNRIEALSKAKQRKLLAEVRADADSVNAKMIADFRDHFSFCPVYYYMDTNSELVEKRGFSGILFNGDGSPVAHPVVSDTSWDYIIVNYGYPSNLPKDVDPKRYKGEAPGGRGLIINNYKFQQISMIHKYGYYEIMIQKGDKPYAYSSKHFDIEYYPTAKILNQRLLEHAEKVPISH